MARVVRLTILLSSIWITGSAWATTYYIAANGSDSNNGTSTSTPWLHAPGMGGCTGNCASKVPVAGDRFVLRGGDAWHAGNQSLTPHYSGWNFGWSGSSSAQIYIGVDNSTAGASGVGTVGWYDPAVCGSSWCRPILQGDNPHNATEISGSCTYTSSLVSVNGNYLSFDNIELDGFCGHTSSGTVMIGRGLCGLHDMHILNMYGHGWSYDNSASGSDAYYRQAYGIFNGDTGGCSPWPANNNEWAYNVFDGSESPVGTGTFIYGDCYNVHHNYLKGLANFVCNNGWNMHDNTWDGWDDHTNHANGLEYNGEGNAESYFYNNKLRHMGNNYPFGAGFTIILANANHKEYVFNNVLYDNHANANWFDQQSGQSGSLYFFNNTIANQPMGVGVFYGGASAGYGVNNHFITTLASGSLYETAPGTRLTERVATPTAEANGGTGYVAGNEFAPTATYHPTASAGTNYMSVCNAILDVNARAACKISTTAGVEYDAVNHKVITPAVAPVARPTSAAWDIGAYQFSVLSSGAPAAPTSLSATVQ